MKSCDDMIKSLLERRDEYVAGQKKKKAILTRTITSVCCVCIIALLSFGIWRGVLTMNIKQGVKKPGAVYNTDNSEMKSGDTEDIGEVSTDDTDNLEDESGALTKNGVAYPSDSSLLRAAVNYKEMIGEAYDVVLGEVIDSGEAIMTIPNYEPSDENGESNRIQKPYNIKVIKSYKGNIEEGKTVSVVTSALANNKPKVNKIWLRYANEQDRYVPGKQYMFILSTETKVIDIWGKNAYFLAGLEFESAFSIGENGKIYSTSLDIVNLNSFSDYVASAEKYISERSDYDEVKAEIAARKAAE